LSQTVCLRAANVTSIGGGESERSPAKGAANRPCAEIFFLVVPNWRILTSKQWSEAAQPGGPPSRWRRGHESRFQELESSCAGSIGAGAGRTAVGAVHSPGGFPAGSGQHNSGGRPNSPARARNLSGWRRHRFHELYEAARGRRDTSRHARGPACARNRSRWRRYAACGSREATRARNDARRRGYACNHQRQPRQGD
jgi:hypothetical protein